MTRAEFFGVLGVGATAPAVTPVEMQAGTGKALVALSFKAPLSQESIDQIKTRLKPYEDEFCVKFLVLCEGTEVVKLV